jgi:hypothetical protein
MYLEFMRNPARHMPTVPNADDITSLMVWHCKFDTMEGLATFKNLKALKIASYPDSSLEPLGELRHLEWLSILHMPKINDLEPLARLKKLTALELATLPSWDASGKHQVVRSLDSLGQLPGLRHVALLGVVPENESLANLEGCLSLRTARASGYPVAEAKRFFSSSPVENAHVPSFPKA